MCDDKSENPDLRQSTFLASFSITIFLLSYIFFTEFLFSFYFFLRLQKLHMHKLRNTV